VLVDEHEGDVVGLMMAARKVLDFPQEFRFQCIAAGRAFPLEDFEQPVFPEHLAIGDPVFLDTE